MNPFRAVHEGFADQEQNSRISLDFKVVVRTREIQSQPRILDVRDPFAIQVCTTHSSSLVVRRARVREPFPLCPDEEREICIVDDD